VAKGVTALGFGMLYAAVFAAYHFYHLIDSTPAFVLAIIVTIAAMFYAVVLDEILIAFLSLLGGFLIPVIVSTGENLPIPLFTYISILGIGAMLCAYFRNWRAVNFLAFAGTFVLYTGWFEAFYHTGGANKQMPIALGWLCVFFVVYLVMPILYELINRVKTHKEDVMLILANAGITLYYLWRILFDTYRAELAFCAVGLSVIHLIMMAVAARRCKDDRDLQVVLLAIGLFFITIAIPLYLKMYAIPMAWAAEGLILAIIGLRYRSEWIQTGSIIPLLLSVIKLILNLPLHTGPFGLVFNPEFGTWCFVAAIIGVYHLVYRRTSESTEEVREAVAQAMYAAMGLLLFAAATMEWYWHCHYNLMVEVSIHYISRGQLPIFAGIVLLFAIRPVCPKGLLSEALSLIIVAGGTIFTLIALFYLHNNVFVIFANLDFIVVLSFVSAMLVCHIKYRQFSGSDQEQREMISQIIYGVLGVLLLLTVTAEWYWHCKYNLSLNFLQSSVLKGQVIIFALVMLLFVTRPICPRGIIPKVMALLVGGVGAIFTMATFTYFYRDSFAIFVNAEFGIVLLFVAAIFTAAWLLNLRVKEEPLSRIFAVVFIIAGIFVLWVLLTEQIYLYWYWRHQADETMVNWEFLAHMYISVMWAVYGAALLVIGFWKDVKMLRYISLGLFVLLLGKVFIWDTRTIENVYRIAAFMATGVTLVGVSYLYQFLKKRGFFEALVIEDN
jgi:uncharacterized membrane protein